MSDSAKTSKSIADSALKELK
ncbi:MAG: hypothetical protein RL008_515, partial [Actinomycetota bacterium]